MLGWQMKRGLAFCNHLERGRGFVFYSASSPRLHPVGAKVMRGIGASTCILTSSSSSRQRLRAGDESRRGQLSCSHEVMRRICAPTRILALTSAVAGTVMNRNVTRRLVAAKVMGWIITRIRIPTPSFSSRQKLRDGDESRRGLLSCSRRSNEANLRFDTHPHFIRVLTLAATVVP